VEALTIAQLNAQKAEIEARRLELRAGMKPMQQELSRLELQLKELDKRIDDAHRQPRVSDHAVIRYLERKYGFSFDRVRAEILTPDRASAINAGATGISHEGVRFLVRDKTITTVVECH
jgi:uncharacterized protein YlxW (UPF0749 family)